MVGGGWLESCSNVRKWLIPRGNARPRPELLLLSPEDSGGGFVVWRPVSGKEVLLEETGSEVQMRLFGQTELEKIERRWRRCCCDSEH